MQPFPDPVGGKWQVSTDGGRFPRWKRDGKELFYLAPQNRLMAVGVTLAPAFKREIPKTLFTFPGFFGGAADLYDVTGDGQKFARDAVAGEATSDAPPAPITVVLNWAAGLKK